MIKNLTPKEIRNQRRTNRSKRNNVAHPTRLRMVVSKSLKHINVQIIDDNEMKTTCDAAGGKHYSSRASSPSPSSPGLPYWVARVVFHRRLCLALPGLTHSIFCALGAMLTQWATYIRALGVAG